MKPAVLFVGGYGRSGSTVIDLELAAFPGIVPVGEFRHLFGRALGDNELCSCGEPFRDCPFWREVLSAAFPDGFDRSEMQETIATLNRLAALPTLRVDRLRNAAKRADIAHYGDAFAAAYRAVLDVTGAEVVVDSSKYPLHGAALAAADVVELKTMLLVRDPRAVAHSWERRRLRPEVHWEERYMPQHNVVRSALAWNLSNRLTTSIKSRELRIQRYEDFAADPHAQIASIARFALGRVSAPAPSAHSGAHTIAGNPVRLSDSPLTITPDTKWMGEMGKGKQLVVASLCLLGMRRHGYPLTPRNSAPANTSA